MASEPSPDATPDPTVRHGRVIWANHPPHGVAHITVESHAFHAMPVSIQEGDPVPYESTPGELLAVVHAMFMAWALAERLGADGTPARELVVFAECSFQGPANSRHLTAIDLSVHGNVPGLDAPAFSGAADEARRSYLRASGARDDIPGSLDTVLTETRGA
jgi:lipoyl-dependent peroxiredoxin